MNTFLLILSIVLLALSILFLIHTLSVNKYAKIDSDKLPKDNLAVVVNSDCFNYYNNAMAQVVAAAGAGAGAGLAPAAGAGAGAGAGLAPEKCIGKHAEEFHNQYVNYRKMCISTASITMAGSIALFIMAIKL